MDKYTNFYDILKLTSYKKNTLYNLYDTKVGNYVVYVPNLAQRILVNGTKMQKKNYE